MSSDSAQKKSLARRGAKTQTLSTSHARANFADALGMAQEQSTVIGFDRYGKLVAAVVPIDAVRMLAGRAKEVAPGVRAKIERMAASMLQAAAPASAPAKAPTGRAIEERAALEPKSKEKRRRRKDKREKKKKQAKAASGKRPRKISRKI